MGSLQQVCKKPTPDEVLSQLLEGNNRFMKGQLCHPHTEPKRRVLASQSSQSQYAIATVLSCSDSRVPTEIIFDCGIMDLFIVRLAGNILCDFSLATIEYGVLHVKTPLVLVLAHSQCGAVTATIENCEKLLSSKPENQEEQRLFNLMQCILPTIKEKLQAEQINNQISRMIIDECAKIHAISIVQHIYEKSKSIATLVDEGLVKILPAFYDLSSGKVQLLTN